ncbi:MAG: hypothetical protein KC468_20730 [Myxococcales bacterium]|nr:hypothetical protein [Myxococcales bacterium]
MCDRWIRDIDEPGSGVAIREAGGSTWTSVVTPRRPENVSPGSGAVLPSCSVTARALSSSGVRSG